MASAKFANFLIFLCLSQCVYCRDNERPSVVSDFKGVLNDVKGVVSSIYHSDFFCYAWKTAAVASTLLVGVPAAVAYAGFGTGGVVAGSAAAAYQSTFIGGSAAAGGLFAGLQSIGAGGLGQMSQAAIWTGSALGVGALFGTKCGGENSYDGGN